MKIVSIIVSLFAVAAFANEPAKKTTTTTTTEHHAEEAAAAAPAAKPADAHAAAPGKKLHKKTAVETKKTETTTETK